MMRPMLALMLIALALPAVLPSAAADDSGNGDDGPGDGKIWPLIPEECVMINPYHVPPVYTYPC